MKKKVLGLVLLAVTILGINLNVYASEDIFYTTPIGIELTREEYDFLTTFYWDGYPDIMTQEMYDDFIRYDLLNREVTIRKTELPSGPFNLGNAPQNTSQADPGKTVQIGSACSDNHCYNSLVATWQVSPNIRSYDVIGAYFYNVSLISHDTTYVYSTDSFEYFNNIKTASNGLGNSVKLPATGSDILINMVFQTTSGGIILGTYQHAMVNTTLAASKCYNFSPGGYGNVLDFYGAATGVYDQMAGVDIIV